MPTTSFAMLLVVAFVAVCVAFLLGFKAGFKSGIEWATELCVNAARHAGANPVKFEAHVKAAEFAHRFRHHRAG